MDNQNDIFKKQIKKIINKLIVTKSDIKIEEVTSVEIRHLYKVTYNTKQIIYSIDVDMKITENNFFEEEWDKLLDIVEEVRDAIKYIIPENFNVTVRFYDSWDDFIASYEAYRN